MRKEKNFVGIKIYEEGELDSSQGSSVFKKGATDPQIISSYDFKDRDT
eukprot:CAMPEP_0170495786 /NCGR_PEP_ID=MMETSP0208-20121228/18612_1 /TAXON_ID=197538 /ORGANISM="Strombidium inclinatum, Strain S3" /LENGTH=47 /DNA_ID= /DNA_START= /DNA_END= /DNA_ORIENTATION=